MCRLEASGMIDKIGINWVLERKSKIFFFCFLLSQFSKPLDFVPDFKQLFAQH